MRLIRERLWEYEFLDAILREEEENDVANNADADEVIKERPPATNAPQLRWSTALDPAAAVPLERSASIAMLRINTPIQGEGTTIGFDLSNSVFSPSSSVFVAHRHSHRPQTDHRQTRIDPNRPEYLTISYSPWCCYITRQIDQIDLHYVLHHPPLLLLSSVDAALFIHRGLLSNAALSIIRVGTDRSQYYHNDSKAKDQPVLVLVVIGRTKSGQQQ